jgi:Iap family predicted aminopeptidase
LKTSQLDNPRLNAERTLKVVRQIRENDSLRPRYETIFNQAAVLLVSYFGSAVGDVFRFGIARELQAAKNVRLLREELRVLLEEILEAHTIVWKHSPSSLS